MDPLTLAFAGGSSLLSGLFGSSAASETAANNQQSNLLNYQLGEEERQDKINAANQERSDRQQQLIQQQEGVTDANGNHLHFVDGQGWVTDLSATGQQQRDQSNQLQQGQGQEKLNELTQDVPLQRGQLQAQDRRQNDAGNQSDALMRMFHNAIIGGKDPSVGGMLYGADAQGINDAYNAEQGEATRAAVRSGSPNSGVFLAALAKQRGKDLSTASVNDYVKGRQMATDDYNSKLSNIGNLQSAFAQQAGTPLGTPYQAAQTSYEPAADSSLGQLQSGSQALQLNDGDQALVDAEGTKGGRLDYQQPNYALANSFASFGNILANGTKKSGNSSSSSNYGFF